jgi:hypothetical protein
VYPLALELELGEDTVEEISLGAYHSIVRVTSNVKKSDYFLSWG